MERFENGITVYLKPEFEATADIYGPLIVTGYDDVDDTYNVEDLLHRSRWVNSRCLTETPNVYTSEDGTLNAGDRVSALVNDEIFYGELVARQYGSWIMEIIMGDGHPRPLSITEASIVRPKASEAYVKCGIGEDW